MALVEISDIYRIYSSFERTNKSFSCVSYVEILPEIRNTILLV
jgi:hypothetical protein